MKIIKKQHSLTVEDPNSLLASLRALQKAGRSNPVKNLLLRALEEGKSIQKPSANPLKICLKLTTGLLRPAFCRARNDGGGIRYLRSLRATP